MDKVNCDYANCKAIDEPESIEELKEALDHWENHMYLSGCSHGW